MAITDFEKAHAAHSALQQFFAKHPKGPLERSALDDLHALCNEAVRAVSDAQCHAAIRKIETYSAILSSAESPRGADFVRLRVQNALASFRSTLRAKERSDKAVVA
jgi:hypothetical protein